MGRGKVAPERIRKPVNMAAFLAYSRIQTITVLVRDLEQKQLRNDDG